MKTFLRVARPEDDRDLWKSSRFPLAQSLTVRRSKEDRIIRVFHKESNHEVYYLVKETIAAGVTAKVKRALKYIENKKALPKEVAIKVFKLNATNNPKLYQIEHDFVREANLLEYLSRPNNRHPNIIKLHDVLRNVELKSKHGINSSYEKKLITGLVLEFINGGELYNYLSTSTGIPMSIAFVRAVFQQLARAVSHLHTHNVVHLDIKPENILLSKTGMVVLTDFGSAQRITNNQIHQQSRIHKDAKRKQQPAIVHESKEQSPVRLPPTLGFKLSKNVTVREDCTTPPESFMKKNKKFDGYAAVTPRPDLYMPKSKSMNYLNGYVNGNGNYRVRQRSVSRGRSLLVTSSGGTLKYRAPEVDDQPFDGAAADIWSLGAVLHVMLYNRVPDRSGLIRRSSSFNILSGGYSDIHNITDSEEDDKIAKDLAADLLVHMCCIDPASRWTIKEIQSHPFVAASRVRGSAKIVAQNVKKLGVYVDDARKRKRIQRRKEREMKKSSSLTSLASLTSTNSFTSLESAESAVSMP
mmetsp:Transcript_1162/g.1536  ORF Transcript_1162/g.1536 Transcript_1162/m.1536 type:complete len:525 (-) Transcript_1162:75-1649(-)|eukprot:CAMPEP_0204831270 /NCGR_PEP_ID=MMETSP1346-20131115/10281_1 /ASSEMBLY_ACC=CAM_ASM_000771 /TAXON_ID=215587 /ORGANISM="Aplanochytrium stocchinoi, Strain GSBS06" /LENGTH=524 /DNA_ID=CAMNT_0051962181 /DNA_START=110 /DNA_END=1684 /DNA_ORIENTATION=+